MSQRANTSQPRTTQPRTLFAATPLDKVEDLSDWLTRPEAADLLHMTESTITNWTKQGKLHPRERPATSRLSTPFVLVYSPRELMKLNRNRASYRAVPLSDGDKAAIAFEAFNEGHTIAEVVIRVRATPPEVVNLYEQWLNAGGVDFSLNAIARRELEALVGPFDTVSDLITATKTAVERHRLDLVDGAVDVVDGASDADVDAAIVKALDAATPAG